MQLSEFRTKYNYDRASAVMQQYLDIKFANPDCLILFRMGDFYELFFEDAVHASKILGIILTKRGKTDDQEIAMCGVPHHSLESYLNKLIEEGVKVAICDQTETPEAAKKRGGYKAVINREVTRIITPGTVIEESIIAGNTLNYLASVALDKQRASICYVDLSTSDIAVVNVPESEVLNELARLSPKEILISDKAGYLAGLITTNLKQRVTYQVDSFFAYNKCRKITLDFFKIADIDAIGEITSLDVCSIGSVVEYITLTQKQNLPLLPLPKIINHNKFMSIDAATRSSLEITVSKSGQSLFSVLDYTVTKAGSRLLYKFLLAPLVAIEAINERLEAVSFFSENINFAEHIRNLLKNVGDIERCLTRIAMGRSIPADLVVIKNTLAVALQVKEGFLRKAELKLPKLIEKITFALSDDGTLRDLIEQAIIEEPGNNLSDGGFIKHSYNTEIAKLYGLLGNAEEYIEELKAQYRQETGIDSLKISQNNVLGLFIEITARHTGKISDPKFLHRQTTANTIRYTTEQLQKLESDISSSRHSAISLENEIYSQICWQILDKEGLLKKIAHSLSMLDVLANFAYLAEEFDYVRPNLSEDLSFVVVQGRHPIVETSIRKTTKAFVGNGCTLDKNNRIWLITGPNMSGKSTFLRQNALIAILAQIGCFVPAKKAEIGVIDKIFSRIGSGDDLARGQSTFMVEMLETSAILAQASDRSLIILDEVGRGTSTYDGVAIAWSVLEYIHDKIRARCLFATHYHELTNMSSFLPALKNYTVAIEESGAEILFLHNIIQGTADKSYGVHVALLAGLPKVVIKRANEILSRFEKSGAAKNKDLLKGESNNLSLFNFNKESMVETGSHNKNQELSIRLKEVVPDSLSPKEALELLYELRKML